MLNKACLVLSMIVLIISGCISTPEGTTQPKPSVSIKMDVKNGHYESLAIDYWEPEYDVCFDINILEVFPKRNWGAQVAWILSDDKGNSLKIYFYSVSGKEFNLRAEHLDNKFEVTNRSTLYKGIGIKEVHSSKFSFNDDYELNFNFKGDERKINLPFLPKKFVINASGVKAEVGYSSINCNIS